MIALILPSCNSLYATLVRAQLGYEQPEKYDFLNRGVGGNRVVDLYARIKKDIINLQPDYLSILIGVNDVWHELGGTRNGVAAEKYEHLLDLIITEVKEALPNTKIMLMEPFVMEGRATRSTEAEPDRWANFHSEVLLRAAAAKRVAEKHHLPFITLQDKFEAASQRAESKYWLVDGVHPTAMGHEIIAQAWLQAFHDL